MLCDSHIHFIPSQISEQTTFYKGIWSDKDKLYDFLDENKIDKAFLVYPSTDASLKLGSFKKEAKIYNQALADILKENSKIIAACLVDIDDLSNIDSELEKLQRKGFSAVTIASSYKGKFITQKLTPLFEAAQKHNLAIFIHPQTINPIGYERVSDPLLMPVLEYSFDNSMFLGLLMMQGVLEKYDIDFIFSSLGGVVPFLKQRFDRVYTMLRKREIVKDLGKLPSEILKKVYVDTSGACLGNIKLALELFGENNIIWGSDYPVNAPVKASLEELDSLGDPLKEKITSANFLKIFK